MKNMIDCSFYIFTNLDETHTQSFDYLAEFKEICDDNNLLYDETEIHLGEGTCIKLIDLDYDGFYELSVITDYHLDLFENGKLFPHQV